MFCDFQLYFLFVFDRFYIYFIGSVIDLLLIVKNKILQNKQGAVFESVSIGINSNNATEK